MGEKHISLARDFTVHPGPRLKEQGPNSGELFREYLLSLLRDHEQIVVNLDGTTGIGSSFIDEAFGKLISKAGMDPKEVRRRVRVISTVDESYLVNFDDSITRAQRARPRS